MKIILVVMAVFFPFLSMQAQNRIAVLSDTLHEISGIERIGDKFFAINDGGNTTDIFMLNSKGKIERSILLKGTTNVDWEDITSDHAGNLFIGDFGNNNNTRQNLKIIRVNSRDLNQDTLSEYHTISFNYQHQSQFPPPGSELKYDCEGMFWDNDKIFLITKNRTDPFDGWMRLHMLNDSGSVQTAMLVDSINVGASSALLNSITGADLFDNKLYALSYTGITVMNWGNGSGHFADSFSSIPLSGIQQYESINVDVDGMWIANETSNFGKASLWTVTGDLSNQNPVLSRPQYKVRITEEWINVPIEKGQTIQKAEIFDLNGKHIYTMVKQRTNWVAGNPGTGIYFVAITDNLGALSVVKILIP